MDVALENGDLPHVSRYITGPELIAQKIRIRLLTWRGEWLLNQEDGIDYLSLSEQKPPDTEAIADLLRAEILGVDGVVDIDGFTVTFTGERLSASGTVRIAEDVLSLSAVIPFGSGEGNVLFNTVSMPFL
ncbi:MAG: hypothetical protein AAFV53_33335 [Myxococcota bacterium]